MKNITAQQLHETKLDSTSAIIDVRTPQEFALEHIENAINKPFDSINTHIEELKKYETIYVYCNTWNTSAQFYNKAHALWLTNVVNILWWISLWSSHYPTIKKKWALPIMQQVQVAAGWLVLLWIMLAKVFHMYSRHEYFIILSAFVWAWLVFAWLSWFCGLAKLLGKMPWNRVKNDSLVTIFHGKDVHIKQFEDKNLSHYSYIAISNGEAIVVDPERNPLKYYDYAKQHNASIVWVLNTHPHADFASGHLQIHEETWAKIYISEKVDAEYPHVAVQDHEIITFGKASIEAYFTPWHSPDSFSYLIKDSSKKQIAFFTGDWLFLGDVGRADLRETVWNMKAKQAELAWLMYDTTRSILPKLDGSTIILPAHGAGTACGKWLSKQNSDTLWNQLLANPMLQQMTKEHFINILTSDQPTIPAYFTNSVLLNKAWNTNITHAIENIPHINQLPKGTTVIDTRSFNSTLLYPIDATQFHIPYWEKAFITMIGTLIQPGTSFVIIVEKSSDIFNVLHTLASIWYEKYCQWVYSIEATNSATHILHAHDYKNNKQDYVILDVRSETMHRDNPIFSQSIHIPLETLQNRIHELPIDKCIIPFCGWTYKSWIAFSMIRTLRPEIAIKQYNPEILNVQ